MTAPEPTRVPPLMTALAQIGGLLAAINPDGDGPVTEETVTAAIQEARRLRARVAELEESNRVILDRKARLADEMAASEGVSNKLVAEADDARLSAERRLRRLLAEIMPMGRTALLDDGTVRAAIDEIHAMDAGTRAAEAQVAAVRADLDIMRDDPMPVPTEASRLPDGATVEEAYTAGWYRAIRAHERGLRRALDAAGTPELASEPASSLQVHGQGASGVATSAERVLRRVLAMLGPEPCSCSCAGSRAEVAEAIRIIREALAAGTPAETTSRTGEGL